MGGVDPAPGGTATPLDDLLRRHADLADGAAEHLHRLVGQWQLLADLSASDLLLWVRVREELADEVAGHLRSGPDDGAYLAVAQARPATGPTVLESDHVGLVSTGSRAPLLARAERSGVTARDEQPRPVSPAREVVPVHRAGRVVALLARAAAVQRPRNELGGAYAEAAEVLLRMTAAGTWPGGGSGPAEGAPRLGDGLLRVERDGTVRLASPNATSALRRLGVAGNVDGRPLAEVLAPLGLREPVATDRAGEVVVAHAGAVVVLVVVPLRLSSVGLGALVLLRDVTEVRDRERALERMDATVREVHHRVKNNLQTVAALLRMQGRRSGSDEVREALAEAERRVQAIARVHSVLTASDDESVALDEVVRQLVDLVGDVAGPGAPRPRVLGTAAPVPSALATPLAVVVTELVQNALEHATADRPGGRLDVVLSEATASDGSADLLVEVHDDGPGPPPDGTGGLGLHIARTLTAAALGGQLELAAGADGTGTVARVRVPRQPPTRPPTGP